MPWRRVTLVPYRSRDDSELGSVHGASSEVEIRTETDLQSPSGHIDDDSVNLPNFEFDALSNFSDFPDLNFDEGLSDGSRPVEGGPCFPMPVVQSQDATISSLSYNRLVSNSFLENARVHDICLPWETPLAKTVFGDDSQITDSLTMPPFLTADQLVVEGETAQVVVESLNQAVTASEHASGVSFFSAVSNMTDCSFLEKKKLVMESACRRWLSILSWCQSCSTVSKHLTFNDAPQDVCSDMEVVQAIIGVRSPSTALSRANVVRKFLAWVFDKHPHVDLPFCESLVWLYFAHLRSIGAAPTTAASTLSAMRYAQHIFGFECLAETTCSRRLIGTSEVMFSCKEAVRQALVLTVQNVMNLHAKLEDYNAHHFDRAGAGFMLLCIYGRCRHSDLALVDRVEHDHNDSGGYVEVFTRYHKTARGAAKKAMFLPILVPAIGINKANWVVSFCAALELCGLTFEGRLQGPILRPPTDIEATTLCERGLASEECSKLLRSLLGLPMEVSGRKEPIVSSHSLKATGLSWSAKFGIPEFDRAVLGRHSSSTSSATAIYARDLAISSVRKYEEMLRSIAQRTFVPDAPRSAYFAVPLDLQGFEVVEDSPGTLVKDEQQPIEVKDEAELLPDIVGEPEVVLSSSEDSTDVDLGSSAEEDEEPKVISRPSKARRVTQSFSSRDDQVWFFHRKSGILHLCRRSEEATNLAMRYFICGRVISANYAQMTERESGNQMCVFCNQRS